MVCEDILQKSLQKHDAVMFMDGCFYNVILTYFITERKITVNLSSYVLAQEAVPCLIVQTGNFVRHFL